MNFNYIAPEQIPTVWRTIRKDVIQCINQDTDDCLIEDVYYFLRANLASLYVCYDEDKYIGFCVLKRIHDMYSGVPKIIVWLCKSKNRKYTEMCFELIKKQAIESGCNKIVFKNTNKSYLRLMKPLGFKQGEMEFICEI